MRSAIIIAGGKGERLRPLTEDKPKCMVPVLGNPLLAFQLKWLRAHGIERAVICCGYLHEAIQSHFGNGERFGIKLEYLVEDQPVGRGGALKAGLRHLKSTEPVLAVNGDHLTNLNVSELRKFHAHHGGIATLVSVPLISPYGIVECSQSDPATVSGFKEKPQLPFWINAGIYVFNPEIVDLLPDTGDHEVTTFPQISRTGQLKVMKTDCFWRTVDTIKDLSELRSQFEEMLLAAFLQPSAAVGQTL